MSNHTAAQLGNMALATDNHPKGATPKLASVGQDVDERFFMLATFCFDLSRKLKYICLALREHWEDASCRTTSLSIRVPANSPGKRWPNAPKR
jgi:hypothetical protein